MPGWRVIVPFIAGPSHRLKSTWLGGDAFDHVLFVRDIASFRAETNADPGTRAAGIADLVASFWEPCRQSTSALSGLNHRETSKLLKNRRALALPLPAI